MTQHARRLPIHGQCHHDHHAPDDRHQAQRALTGSDYVRAVIDQLIELDVPVDVNALDLDGEQCNIPIANVDEIVWLRWLDDPEHGWHLDDEHGRRSAAICAPDTPPTEAAQILVVYI